MKYVHHLKNNGHLVFAFSILVGVMVLNSQTRSEPSKEAPTPVQIDTIIPKGYVLVPIELENKDAISSVIQDYGLIDLYLGNPQSRSSKKIAQRIKLLRAPYNANLFAVLVKDQFASSIMKESGQFYAVVQNKLEPEGINDGEVAQISKTIQIEYQK